MCGVPVRVGIIGMQLDLEELRTAFRAVVGRIAAGRDEVARARWWKWVEEAVPAPYQTCPGRLTVSLGDMLPAPAVRVLRERAAHAPVQLKEAV